MFTSLKNKKYRLLSVTLYLLLVLVLTVSLGSCIVIGPGGNNGSNNGKEHEKEEAEEGENLIVVNGGYLSSGTTRGTFEIGEEFTIVAEDLPGVYFDYWTKNGVKLDDSATVYVAKADGKDGEQITYVANYRRSNAATFEDVALGEINGTIVSDRYNISFGTSSHKVKAEVITDPDDMRNQIIKYVDDDSEEEGYLRVSTAAVVGDFLVYNLDFKIESFLSNVPLQIKMGNYELHFYASGSEFKICDLSSTGTGAYLKTAFYPDSWHNLTVYVVNEEIGGVYPHSYILLDGECVAESYNVSKGQFSDAVSFYTSGQSEIVAYLDNLSAYRTTLSLSEQTAMDPAFVVEKGYVNTDAYAEAEIILDEDALAALKAMDESLFSEDIYRWIAELYDPETSAIYFSISGRDNYGYLPDIETVAQAYGILGTLGIGGASTVLNDEQKANLLSWIQTLQSNRDGYYYHPHWGVSINNSRLSRDLGNSSSSFGASGYLAYRLFDDANYRLSDGKSGNAGVTSSVIYNSNLPGRLIYSDVSAVSKVLLTSSMSSMPHHLRSEENLITHVNNYWNNTCRVSGTHERHFCTDSCVIVDDPSDSYMRFVDGKLVITRGKRCKSCHVCSHTLGHSYSFGHYFTSMGAQVKSAGLGTPLVMYFYDIQENVQATLRDRAEAKYIEENGQRAWDALTNDQRTAIRRAAENGIWEETVTYNTISGLLKICGIPTAHGYEFLYAEAAINSAIDGALFSTEDFISRREAIVSIYNPFNAINGIMGNITKYGSDPSVRTEAMAVIRHRAKDLIENTTVKLACYLMPDGGYSYSMSGYCTHSQGQPVAINGWNNGIGEGDVNGTALALGTRGALVSCLGISVGSPFSGARAKYSDEGYDLNCDGVIDEQELEATHTQVFRSLITNKKPIEKVDLLNTSECYDFEGTDPITPSSGDVVSDGDNKVLMVVDDMSSAGCYTTFLGGSALGDEAKAVISFDMKVINSNNTVTHQLFGGSNNSLYINWIYNNGRFTFQNVSASGHMITDIASGENVEVNAKEWFNLTVEVYIGGKNIDGKTRYGILTVTQDGVSRSGYLNSLNKYSSINQFDMYSLNGSLNTVYYDNVSCKSVLLPGVYDGEYHFDTVEQKIREDMIKSPTNEKDTVYPLDGNKTATFTPDQYSTSYVIYNFDYFWGSFHLSEMKAGERVYFAFKDKTGKIITGIYLELKEDGSITFFAANGQILRMSNRNRELYGDDNQINMNLNADLSKWITVKLEYHYDMDSPQLDVVVKYADEDNNGYNRTVASTLIDVAAYDEGASAKDFGSFDINYAGSSDSKICIDDLYIRNVYVP